MSTQTPEAEIAKVKFGIVTSEDPHEALRQLLTLDSDGDGTPNYRDKAPFDPKVSFAPGDHNIRRAAGLSTVAGPGVPSYRPGANEDDWSRDVMHAVTKDGGFTFRDVMGDGPKKGFMVSVAKRNEQKIPMRDLTPEHIADYMSVHQQELKDPHNYLGGWVYKGNVYLDISRHSEDRNQALALARANKQIGIYDIGSGQTLITDDYDEHGNQRQAQPPQPGQAQASLVVGKPTGEQLDDPTQRLAYANSFLTSLQRAAASVAEEE